MTDTPLTDARWEELLERNVGPGIFNVKEWALAGQMADFARTLERRSRELELAIESAPHDKFCRSHFAREPDYDPTFDAACNCWKSRIGKEG